MLSFVRYVDIDKVKWNNCVSQANQNRIYAYAWYLDITTERQWDGLVYGDYTYVFPLPYNDKIPFFRQIYTPVFAQQLGLYGPDNEVSIWNECLSFLFNRYKKINLKLNDQLPYSNLSVQNQFIQQTNYILDLARPYSEIAASYNRNVRRNIAKSENQHLTLTESAAPLRMGFIDQNFKYLNNRQVSIAHSLIKKSCDLGMCKIVQCTDQKNNLLAVVVLTIFRNRIVPMLAYTSEDGRKIGAYHYLINSVFKYYSGKNFLFDFEGSNDPDIARFMQSFGCINKPYYSVQKDKLPLALNYIINKRKSKEE